MKEGHEDLKEQPRSSATEGLAEDYLFVLSGKSIGREEAIGYPVLVAGFGQPDERLVYVFKSDDDFARWSELTIFGEQISRVLASIAQAQEKEGEDLTALRLRRQAKAARILDELQELSDRTGLPPGSPELFLRASVNTPLLEDRIVQSLFLCMDLDFAGSWPGRWLVLWAGGWPDLGWSKWSNVASAAFLTSAVSVLCDLAWFRGRKVWLMAAPWASPAFPRLSALGFDNATSSVWVG